MKHNIDLLLDKYWEGESTLEEESLLKTYFQSDDVADDHLEFLPLFAWMKESANLVCTVSTDVDELLAKYWDGETTVKEEAILKAYFKSSQVAEQHQAYTEMFLFFDQQSQVRYEQKDTVKLDVKPVSGSKVMTLGIKKWIYAVAAVSTLVLGAVFVMKNMNPESTNTKYANIHEIEDPEEALRVTKEALALVSKKFRKSQESIKENMGALEKASIFK